MIKEETKAVLLRLSLDVADWIDQRAARMLASRNSEIVRSAGSRFLTALQLWRSDKSF
jgi:hypothetical protein